MAAEDERGVSPFPQPPAMFYKQYTDDNIKSGKAPDPPAPIKGSYSVFGANFDVSFAMSRIELSKSMTHKLFKGTRFILRV